MKLVKEILYEKFTEEGDPIHDMGIGIRNILYKISMKKLSHSSFNSQSIVRKVSKMMRLPPNKIYDLSELHNGESKTQALIEKSKVIINLDYHESTVGASLVLYKNKYGIILVENDRNYWGDIDVVLHIGIEKFLNEKFTEEGDPINDLGIGIIAQFNKWLKKHYYTWSEIYKKRHKNLNEIIFINLLRSSDTPYKYEFMELMLKQGVNPNAEHLACSSTGGFLREVTDINDKKAAKLLLKYGADPNITKHFLFLSDGSKEMKDFILQACEEYNKRKHVNEKFTDDSSDPIRDLGIGAYSLKMLVSKIKFDSSEFQEYMKQHNIGAKVVSVHTTVYVIEFLGGKTELRKLVRTFMPGYPSDLLNDKIFKVFEKFTEEGDPIRDMHIGLSRPITFNNKREITKWVLKNLNYILDVEKIPTDIIIDDKWYIKLSYLNKIKEYCSEYFSVIESTGFDVASAVYPDWEYIRKYFEKKGYPTNYYSIIKEHVNEKFTEEGDPIEDLGISYITVKLYPHFDTKNGKIISTYLTAGNDPSIEYFLKFLYDNHITYEIIKNTTPGKWPTVYFTGSKNALIKMCVEMFDWSDAEAKTTIKKSTIEESLYEKFTEEGDPIHDMGIGILAPKVFHTREQLIDYIIEVLPYIYGGKIPEDILMNKETGTTTIPNRTYNKICDFLDKCKHKMKYREKYYDDFKHCVGMFSGWVVSLRSKLINMGYKEK